MSKKKRKPKVIRVEKVIIKADEVIIEDHGKKRHHDHDHHEDRHDDDRRDPWGFFGPGPTEEIAEEVESDDEERKDEASEDDDQPQGGFSWF
ncbi:hypothetical protein [Alkalihalobacillus sp. CinArs1]|uniref:hypothetical protein n=1 Tax=Alkalihalobacillus sp. CinArs1 TaxID=2995314 RepID=UPI0022DDC5AA|nr:hypothetical protein [Alkalihalobacillus sp. CinArs1]